MRTGAEQARAAGFGPLGRAAAALVLAVSVAGCNGGNAVRDAAQGAGLVARPSEPADFVRESRADAPSGFMPVGVRAEPRQARLRTPQEIKAIEAEMERDRTRLEASAADARRAGATPPAVAPRLPRQ
jgi:hypothetical protein